MIGKLREMDDGRTRARMARTGIIVAVAALSLAAPVAAHAAGGFITVGDVTLERQADAASISATVVWDRASAAGDEQMVAGDLRAVAVDDRTHRATVLATKTVRDLDEHPRQDVTLTFTGPARLAAIARGNRVVLTATQHRPVRAGSGQQTNRSYVTVGEAQPYGTPQGRIGRRDCAAVAVVPGARMDHCDLVGADFDDARISERYPQGGDTGTRMLVADLTGVTARRADLTGTSLAGGRMNDADLTEADISNVSMVRTEAHDLTAVEAVSDPEQGTAGADLFAADLARADFARATLNGVSFGRSTLTGARFANASWEAVEAEGADFRGANLRDVRPSSAGAAIAPKLTFADLAEADLRGAAFLPTDLTWSILCHTPMPSADQDGASDRDCRAKVDPGPTPVAQPLVEVYGNLRHLTRPAAAAIVGTVRWNTEARDPAGANLRAGDIRVVAIDARTGLATTIATRHLDEVPAVSGIVLSIGDARRLAALERGNRVVLTATQHAYRADRDPATTSLSYVTVDTLQAGPGRGRVGSRDCSDQPIAPGGTTAIGYDFCDLAGATLDQAELTGAPMHDVDLSGASMRSSHVHGVILDGSALTSVQADGATFESVTAVEAAGRGMSLAGGSLDGSQWRMATLRDADFSGTEISGTTFAATPLPGAVFTKARLVKDDLAYTDLGDARLDGMTVQRENSLFMADLTGATLKGPLWPRDEDGNVPWDWSIQCGTTLPPDRLSDRDCPR
jgi:uncharacterized protein YjbI with pentapeptide repeats